MGYAGYSPGNQVADKLTPLQQALRALPLDKAADTLELIEKLTRNVVRNPAEDKFRHIKLTNPKIAAVITDVPFAVDILKEMGRRGPRASRISAAGTREGSCCHH
eukprot:TRINITY_DN11375_c0_g2_i1.p1 TRINITY_DN11375_c0_g2~~TRINITY_DN11375_c0_g2_i1.p1  ORF type:complete len:105 (+),score=15.09 TRINITY_DN11375_c0_g2_i1:122-436(+)